MKNTIVFLAGPTAVGKTRIAISLAKKINAEIVSCDSMQIYKTMDILTSKPPRILRKEVPHHLVDIVSPAREYDVTQYRRGALRTAKEIIRKGKIPLFVGGTGLYISVLIDGIFHSAAKDAKIRKKLYQLAQKKGSRFLYERLRKIDPPAADKIHPNDTKRIVRALEVFEASGKPISKLQKQRQGLADDYDVKIFCLNMPREKLYQRIDARVEKMFRQGLVAEVKKLLKLKLSKTAAYAIGIREIKGYLDGLYGLDEVKRLIKKHTRNYAKRQLTWFRRDKRIEWINVCEEDRASQVTSRINSYL